MKIRIIAAIISFVVALSVLYGCGEKQPVSSIPVETASATETTVEEVTESVDITVADSEEETTVVPSETTETASQTETESVTESAPSSVEEIVAYFNTSVNRIKPVAKKVVKNCEKRTVNEEKVVFPAGLESTAESMMATFMKDDTDPIIYETREDITNEFIVPNQYYSSRLTAEWVKSASLIDKGSQYIVNIKLKDHKNPTAGNGVGAVCDVIEVSEVAEKASFVEKFSTVYYNCEIIATIDKVSGNIVHIRYITPVALEMTVNMFGTHDVSVGFTFEKDYSITY